MFFNFDIVNYGTNLEEVHMAHIDTLKEYKTLIARGYSEEKAEAAVHLVENSVNDLVTKDILEISLNKLEKDLKIFFAYTLGGTLLTAILFPTLVGLIITGILKLLGKI